MQNLGKIQGLALHVLNAEIWYKHDTYPVS